MKILGLEIKMAKTASEVVQVIPSTIETKPSIPLKDSYPKAEIGDSGTRGLSGIITEEYNPTLQGREGVRVFDQMRKSDGTVRAAVLACTLPIRRTEWYVKPASDEPQDKEIADFVRNALFDWLEDMTFDDVIRQACISLPLGVMVFEKVYGIKESDGKSYVYLKKLAPRLPSSIQQWELTDKTLGIQQIRQDGVMAQIPWSKLVVFINEREGNNYWGTSILRAAYKHWYYKEGFYKIDAIAFERQGLGVPKITMPVGYTENDERKAAAAMRNLRANENAWLLLPPNYTAEFMNMGAATTRDPSNSINHHNKEILQSVLAQFLDLGQTSSGSGSHALSSDHSDLFLKGAEAVIKNIASTINKDIIEELVNLNFNNVTKFPTMDYSDLTREDVTALSNAYSTLKNAGAIKSIPADQQYLRSLLGLPQMTQEEMDETEEEDDDEEEDTTMEDGGPTEDMVEEDDQSEQEKKDDKKIDKEVGKKKASTKHIHSADCIHNRTRKKKFDDSTFTSWRPLTFAEKKVTFANIETTINDIEESFDKNAREILEAAKNAFMTKLYKAIKDNDLNAIKELEIDFAKKYKAVLKETMKSAYEYGKNNVSTEIDVNSPANKATSIAEMDLLADTMAARTAEELSAKAKVTVTNALIQDLNPWETVGIVNDALDDLIGKAVISAKGLVVSQSLNNGRNDVFERHPDKIYALQRSEVLDAVTCNFCLSMDGRVVSLDDSWATTDVFHNNCRGIWVAILKEETEKPDIGGIPDNLDDYYTGTPNGLTQPARPITLEGTLADDYAKRDKKK